MMYWAQISSGLYIINYVSNCHTCNKIGGIRESARSQAFVFDIYYENNNHWLLPMEVLFKLLLLL